MERLTRVPWGPLGVSTFFGVATLVAIFGFGAPPLILLPVAIGVATLDAELNNRVQRRSERR